MRHTLKKWALIKFNNFLYEKFFEGFNGYYLEPTTDQGTNFAKDLLGDKHRTKKRVIINIVSVTDLENLLNT